MRLTSFRVRDFRSVDESGWIETDSVTALIGANESGKSNLLLPLWKLKPAKGGEIKPSADFPRKKFTDYRNLPQKPVFIDATFEPTEELKDELVALTGASSSEFEVIEVSKGLDGQAYVTFPKANKFRVLATSEVAETLEQALTELSALVPMKVEEGFAKAVQAAVRNAQALLPASPTLTKEDLARVSAMLIKVDPSAKTGAIAPRYSQVQEAMVAFAEKLDLPVAVEVSAARDLAFKKVPSFVYYTNYGNLDSEIYLPHVIENLSRSELGAKEQAKARTLKVLFEFVGLQPSEILELGREFKAPVSGREPTESEIAEIAEKKKQRSILLQSASTKLTKEFRDWWKQGDYRFRFEADGDHFRIWVSDDKRPEEIELEGRSTGLQWFLSFYLVFLVESKDSHEGSILLLDEPGTSLHPLAQQDLSAFFESLSETNQLIYTTHSPFLIDPDHLDRARKVFVAADGTTKASADLRANEGDKTQKAAGYAVNAALGLSVAESMLLGCSPVIVEGLSDQLYLGAIKSLLISAGRIAPGREAVFPPAGGAKGVKAVAGLLVGRDEVLPRVLLDGDKIGTTTAGQLRTSLYASTPEKVLTVDQFVKMAEAEIEDLIPAEVIAMAMDRWQRGSDVPLSDVIKEGECVVAQIESWATTHRVELEAPAWKVELAKRVKQLLLTRGVSKVPEVYLDLWTDMFKAMGLA